MFSVQVGVRIRPPLENEISSETTIKTTKNSVQIIDTQKTLESSFHRVFDESSSQESVYSFLKQSIGRLGEGFSLTVLAYGQTGSGKTYTMFGPQWNRQVPDISLFGVVPRCVEEVFLVLQDFTISCSVLQLYNENIYDLLEDPKRERPLKLRNQKDGVYVEGASEYVVSSAKDCIDLVHRGESNRAVRNTRFNPVSSRSHLVFSITFESDLVNQKGNLIKGKVHLCDLAGSERLDKTGPMGTGHILECNSINLSLTTLGLIIKNLASKKKQHIPYRNSKLTHLLRDHLGIFTPTYLLATVSPSASNIYETIKTVKFASLAKNIAVQPRTTQISANDPHMIEKLQKEVKYLRELLYMRNSGMGTYQELQQKLLNLQEENQKLKQAWKLSELETLKKQNKQLRIELQKLQTPRVTETPESPETTPKVQVRIRTRKNTLEKRSVSVFKPKEEVQSQKLRTLEQLENFKTQKVKQAIKNWQKEKKKEKLLMRKTQMIQFRQFSEFSSKCKDELHRTKSSLIKAEQAKTRAILDLKKLRDKIGPVKRNLTPI